MHALHKECYVVFEKTDAGPVFRFFTDTRHGAITKIVSGMKWGRKDYTSDEEVGKILTLTGPDRAFAVVNATSLMQDLIKAASYRAE